MKGKRKERKREVRKKMGSEGKKKGREMGS